MKKLMIGTAQFGSLYGVTNHKGPVSYEDALEIIRLAEKYKIDSVDTAISYSNSHNILGKIGADKLRIVTKLPEIKDDCNDIEGYILQALNKSLSDLEIKSIYGLLLHSTGQLYKKNGKKIFNVLKNLKSSDKVKNIGYSIYSPNELDDLIDEYKPDIVQAPMNVFDQRMQKTGWLKKLKELNIEIHIRSIFLQGILLSSSLEKYSYFRKWESHFDKWYKWLKDNKLTNLEGSFLYPSSFNEIDKIIIGIQNKEQLKEILLIDKKSKKKIDYSGLMSTDERLISPNCWKL